MFPGYLIHCLFCFTDVSNLIVEVPPKKTEKNFRNRFKNDVIGGKQKKKETGIVAL